MNLILTNQTGSFDITNLVSTVHWSGSCTQCARTLSFELLADGAPDCPLGCHVSLSEGGKNLFTGIVLTRTWASSSPIIDLTAFDYGVYLNQNQTSKKFVGMTPEAATAALCGEFGISTGTLAPTGVAVSRKFFAKSLYEVIMTMYSVAAGTTGKQYFVLFEGTTLQVLEKGAAGTLLVVRGGSNLIDASTTESAAQVVNRVIAYDENENLIKAFDDAESAALFGVMQRVIRQGSGEDAAAKAADLLRGAQPEQKITVNCLGDRLAGIYPKQDTPGQTGQYLERRTVKKGPPVVE